MCIKKLFIILLIDVDTCRSSIRIIQYSLMFFFVFTEFEKVNPLKNFKEKASEEGHSYKNLLLSMVRLIHANPLLMLNVICLI